MQFFFSKIYILANRKIVGIMEPYLTVNTGFIHAIAFNVLPMAYHLIPPPPRSCSLGIQTICGAASQQEIPFWPTFHICPAY